MANPINSENSTEVFTGVVAALAMLGKGYTWWQKRRGEGEKEADAKGQTSATPEPCRECKEDLREAREYIDLLEVKIAGRDRAHDEDRERWIARCEQAETMSRNNAVLANDVKIEADRLRAEVDRLTRLVEGKTP